MFREVTGTFILLSLIIASPRLYAQKADDTKPCDQQMVFVHDLYRQGNGWDISFIDSSKILSKEFALKNPDPVYSGVTGVQLGLKSNKFDFPLIMFNRCSRDASMQESRMFVTRVFALKKNDRTFAYDFLGGIENLVNGKWEACLCGTEIYVYDPDGKGQFSHLIAYSLAPPYVPEWVHGVPKAISPQ